MVTLFVLAALKNQNNEILLLRRKGTTFGDGLYGFVGGKVEAGERALDAIKREVDEEVGLDLSKAAFELVHTFHRKGTDSELIALIFSADVSGLYPINKEPQKHDDMQFFAVDQLPKNIISAHAQAIDCIKKGITYSEHGW